MATTKKGGRPASGTAKPLMNNKDRKIAELEASLAKTQAKLEETKKQFDVEMYACGLNYQDMITKFSDFIEKCVANASVRLYAQRRTHNTLYNIAVAVSDWDDELRNGRERERVMISRANVDEIKSWVKAVADHDAVRMVDNLLEHMCKDVNHWAHDIAQQVIFELEETATDKREIIEEIGKRYSLVTHQTHMILDKDAFSDDEKRDRIKYLADDIAAQIKINPDFDFDDTIVPHVISSSQKATAEPLATIDEHVDELFFPDRTESPSNGIPPAESTVRPASDKAKLHTEIAELKTALEAERETKDSIGDQLASSVLSIMIQLDFQRRLNQGLVELAEHLNAYFKGTRSLPDLLLEFRLAKDVVQRLADGDQVTNIDDQLHGLCYNTGHAGHQIGRQVLNEYRDGENPDDEELLTAMRERLQNFGAQLKLAQESEAVNDDACTSVKSRAFIWNMQVQFQSGTAFSFGTTLSLFTAAMQRKIPSALTSLLRTRCDASSHCETLTERRSHRL